MFARSLFVCAFAIAMFAFANLQAQTGSDTISCVDGQYFIAGREYQKFEISDTLRKNPKSAELIAKHSTKNGLGIAAIVVGAASGYAFLSETENQMIRTNSFSPNTLMAVEFCITLALTIEGITLLSSASDDYDAAINEYNSGINEAKTSAYDLNLGINNNRVFLMLNF